MALKDVFAGIKKSFTLTKKVEFAEIDLIFELETLTSQEEIKVLEAIKDISDVGYLDSLKKATLAFSIKKVNNDEVPSVIESLDEKGQKIMESKFLFMSKEIDSWSSSLRDSLFDAYSSLQSELEEKIEKGIKFDKFVIQEKLPDLKREETGAPKGFKKVEETNRPETETESLNQKVAAELEQAQAGLDEAVNKAQASLI